LSGVQIPLFYAFIFFMCVSSLYCASFLGFYGWKLLVLVGDKRNGENRNLNEDQQKDLISEENETIGTCIRWT